MDINLVWEDFIKQLHLCSFIENAYFKKFAGLPFLYIKHTLKDNIMEKISLEIMSSSAVVMRGKQLHCETVFVREERNLIVFRHRFYVPQKKMFCCGNLCSDCIRFNT